MNVHTHTHLCSYSRENAAGPNQALGGGKYKRKKKYRGFIQLGTKGQLVLVAAQTHTAARMLETDLYAMGCAIRGYLRYVLILSEIPPAIASEEQTEATSLLHTMLSLFRY